MMKESHSSEEKMFRENHYLTISDLIPDETNLLIRMLKFIAMFTGKLAAMVRPL